MNLISLLISIVILLDLRYNQNLNRAIFCALFPIAVFLIIFIYFNESNDFGLSWVLIYPIMAVGLMGSKKGLLVSLLFLAVVYAMAYNGIGKWENGEWQFIGFVRLFFSSLMVTLVAVGMDIALEESYRKLEKLSFTDSLTSLYNRRYIEELLAKEIEKSNRYDKELGLILFDIDDFKNVNDTYGHSKGDQVLKKLTKSLASSLRDSDSFGRWGGEEFLIIVPEISEKNLQALSEKLRLQVLSIDCEIEQSLSCSFGLCMLKEDDTFYTFIDRADGAMYKAKENGKNRIFYS